MNDHLAKPIDLEVLQAKLQQWAKRQKTAGQSALRTTPEQGPDPAGHALDAIAGLDVRLGLRHVSGRESLYLNLLARFVKGQADSSARIADALAAANWRTAEIEAHTLKGVAAQIGAHDIQALAGQLEEAIHQHQPDALLAELQARISHALPRLINAIAERLPQSLVARSSSPIDAEKLRAICRELSRLLHNDDFASGQFIDDNEAILHGVLGDHFPRIAEAINHYEFAAALCWLDEALLTHEITL